MNELSRVEWEQISDERAKSCWMETELYSANDSIHVGLWAAPIIVLKLIWPVWFTGTVKTLTKDGLYKTIIITAAYEDKIKYKKWLIVNYINKLLFNSMYRDQYTEQLPFPLPIPDQCLND